ncbi:hypothetical protein GCM10017783_09850 [Deinococcus piscis]|uniref:Uncharacterized protein n=1 Tax=Deinococcus piscis TaxID=394230 RepID=A0ABQ3K2T0_9DEIO|nr:hypothetical protein [Deinococcus piscis]GHF99768.1 hypothetical protein GCM10017783_09850 [Deinococcus piscis]
MSRKPRTHRIDRAEFYEVTGRLQHYACFHCRKAFKQPLGSGECLCPQCRQPMTNMGTDFRAPPQRDAGQWRKVEALAEAGVGFFPSHPDGLPGEGPATLAEVPAFLRRICPPSAAEKMLAGRPQRSRAPREGKLGVQGQAPRQTFFLFGDKLMQGQQLEVWHGGTWQPALLWGRNGAGAPSHLVLLNEKRQSIGQLPLDPTLRLRWPQ